MFNSLPPYLTISSEISTDLTALINQINPDKYAFLVDENTKAKCLPLFTTASDHVIEIESGESNKTLKTCQLIWGELTSLRFTRRSLLINLGGGVIGDMGGFCAATFKRGIAFVNIPTTLLSQVDASIGGKLAIDFNGLKNHIGLFQEPNSVIIYTNFLETLTERELKSGFAEIIKHSLIKDKEQWKYLETNPFEEMDWDEIVAKSIKIKNDVVTEDMKENGPRKILNYGHTVGHAIETYFLNRTPQITHGESVALGMIYENKIAVKLGLLNEKEAILIEDYLNENYTFPEAIPDYDQLVQFLMQDKKNDEKGIRFSLLDKIGNCKYDVLVEEQILKETLK